ncbi:MAG: hypothetical protein IT436_09895 [Phycisphaerales bacterium]|nr:hypothetical protein [Phycisphaerales bacterium]
MSTPAPRHPQSSRNRPAPASRATLLTSDAARSTAYAHLADIAARLPDLDPRPLADKGLSPRDAAFAHAIVHAGLQRWITLAHIVSGYLARPFPDLEPALRGALIGGAAQILFLDKVPVHAAINETVEWAKSAIRPGAGSMVNAVLRKVAALLPPAQTPRRAWTDRRDELLLADGSARALSAEILPEETLDRLAVNTSHPLPLAHAWTSRFGIDIARRLLLHSLYNPPTVLYTAAAVNPLPASLSLHQSPHHRVFTGPRAELQAILAERPDVWVQDAASSIAVAAAADVRPALILDLCAGQGTKTRQLAHTFAGARIIATDTDADRLSTLRKVFSGSNSVEVVKPAEVAARCPAGADLILLDVPCSNTGVLARRTEAKYRWAPRATERLVKLQRSIIETSYRLLATGGRILYSTCSLEAEENEQQADWAARQLGLRIATSRLTLPDAIPGEAGDRYRDGSFHALLTRDA